MKNHSPFAEALRALLDDCGLFTRREWAQVLGVSTAAISQWVNDRTIPEPENLRSILRIVRGSDRVPAELLDRFTRVASAPSAQVSPHGLRAGQSFADYMTRPLFATFERMWNGLTPVLKEAVLSEALELCSRAFRSEEVLAQADARSGWTVDGFLDALSRLPAERREQVLAEATALCAQTGTAASGWATPDGGTRLHLVRGIDSGSEPVPETAAPRLPRSRSVRVVGSLELEDALRGGARSIAALGAEHPVAPEYGFFELRRGHEDDPRRKIALWRVPRSGQYGSFKVNELFLYVLRGAVRYRFSPSRDWIELDATSGQQVLWIRSAGADSGIPPFEVRTTSAQKPLVLAVFYCKGGVAVDEDASGNWFQPREAAWSPSAETGPGDATLLVTGEIPREP